MEVGKIIFAPIQYVIDSILNHNKEATAHSDIRTAITEGDKGLRDQLTVLQGNSLVRAGEFWQSGDLNTANQINKWYSIGDSSGVQNLPFENCNNSCLYVYGQTQDCFTQIFITSKGDIFKRNFTKWASTQWGKWSELATVEKTCVSKVIRTKEELDNKNLESGIYSVEEVKDPELYGSYYMLIVNKHRRMPDYGTQLAIPYENGYMKGLFQRNSTPSGWSPWTPYAYSSTFIPNPTVGVTAAHGETPRIVKVGKLCTLYGTVNITAISNTYHIFDYIPPEYKPIVPAEIMVSAVISPQLPYHARLYVNIDGSISIHGLSGATTSDVTFCGSWEVL